MSKSICPGCKRDCDTVPLAGYRNWCFECFDSKVPELPSQDVLNGWYLEEFAPDQWHWVAA